MDRQLGAVFGGPHDPLDIGDDETGIDALAEQIEGEGDQIDIAGALAIAKEGALDPVGPRHHRKLGRGNRGAAVIVRVQAENEAVAVANMAGEPFDLVGIDIGGRHLDGARQVDDHLPLWRRAPHIHHRLADLDREIELGSAEALRRILVDDLGLGDCRGKLVDLPGAADRDVDDAGLVEAEDDPALQFRGRIVEVNDRPAGAPDRREGFGDQLGARLRQHLNRHVLGDQVLLDDLPHEGEIGVRGRREPDLDLLEAEAQQEIEHAALLLGPHRFDERLIAVAQIDRAPHRCLVDDPRGPLAIGQVDGRERPVFVDRHDGHSGTPGSGRRPTRRGGGGCDGRGDVAGGLNPSGRR